MTTNIYLGIDMGSSSLKALALDAEGGVCIPEAQAERAGAARQAARTFARAWHGPPLCHARTRGALSSLRVQRVPDARRVRASHARVLLGRALSRVKSTGDLLGKLATTLVQPTRESVEQMPATLKRAKSSGACWLRRKASRRKLKDARTRSTPCAGLGPPM